MSATVKVLISPVKKRKVDSCFTQIFLKLPWPQSPFVEKLNSVLKIRHASSWQSYAHLFQTPQINASLKSRKWVISGPRT